MPHKPKKPHPAQNATTAPVVPQDATVTEDGAPVLGFTMPQVGEAPSDEQIAALAATVQAARQRAQLSGGELISILESFFISTISVEHLYTASLHNEVTALTRLVRQAIGDEITDDLNEVDLEVEADKYERTIMYARLLYELGYLRRKGSASRLIVPAG